MTKGNRRERQAKKKLEEMGYRVHKKKDTKWDSSDMLGLYDLFATDGEEIRFIQVKSNRTGGALKKIKNNCPLPDVSMIKKEVWIFEDYEGIRIKRLVDNEWIDHKFYK